MKLTPVLFVDAIETSLPFFCDRLGFEKTVEVPHGDRLGFVILVKDEIEVMLQTWASVKDDVPALATNSKTLSAGFFVEVEDFEETRKRLEGCEVVVPERTTFYGTREIGVREPGGHVLIFAAPASNEK